MSRRKYNYLRPTLRFCIAGLFIPGFTLMPLLGVQMGVERLGLECARSWIVLWTLTAVGTVVAPVFFIRQINTSLEEGYNFTTYKLLVFNIVEYTLIQCTFATFFTSGATLCYVTDGQNGLAFVFTGWMAIPLLAMLSFVFDRIREKRIEALAIDES